MNARLRTMEFMVAEGTMGSVVHKTHAPWIPSHSLSVDVAADIVHGMLPITSHRPGTIGAVIEDALGPLGQIRDPLWVWTDYRDSLVREEL